MRILDWRPVGERWLARRPSPPSAGAPAGPLAKLAGTLADAVAARRAARRSPPPTDVLVAAIGNLRVGGTGKTPVVAALAAGLQARGVRGAILVKGHGSRWRGPLAVAPDDPRGADEARLHAGRLAAGGGWTVLQARDRPAGLARLLAACPRPQIVLLEDGFQTAQVGRHLDILILDDWTVDGQGVRPRTGPVMPLGPYRETARGAARASAWLLEAAEPPACSRARVLGFRRTAELAPAAFGGEAAPDGPAAGAPWGLLAGLARPEAFEATAGRLLPGGIVLSVRCRDHCRYDARLVARILRAGRREGVGAWATTEKDWVKLREGWPRGVPVRLIRQGVVWTGSEALPDLLEERLAELADRRGSP